MAAKEIVLTPEGREELLRELAWREGEHNDEIVESLKEARGFGDLSENAEFDAAKEEQARNASRVNEIRQILATARIVEAGDAAALSVSIGTTAGRRISVFTSDRSDLCQRGIQRILYLELSPAALWRLDAVDRGDFNCLRRVVDGDRITGIQLTGFCIHHHQIRCRPVCIPHVIISDQCQVLFDNHRRLSIVDPGGKNFFGHILKIPVFLRLI